MLPGNYKGKDVTILTAYEGVGAVLAGQMTEADLKDLERSCAPTVGSCPGQFTANTMAMVAETLGLAIPGSAMMPAVYSERLALAREAGRRVTQIIREGGPLPRDLITRKSLENAAAAVAATGGSTNAGLHLPAIAHEVGISFTLEDVAKVFARTPLIADLQPGGKYLALDLHRVGGTRVVLKALLDGGYLHGDALTLSGKTLADELSDVSLPDGQVVYPTDKALMATGGMMVGYIGPEAAELGPIAYLQNGDMVHIDANTATLDVLVDSATWDARVKNYQPPVKEHLNGILEKYARLVSPARLGAVTHSGGITSGGITNE